MVSNQHQKVGSSDGGLREPRPEQLPIPQVYQLLESRPEGLSRLEVEGRLEHFGRNALRELPQKPLLLRLIANFTHMMALLLWAGGAVAFIAQLPQMGVAIWLVNVINGSFSFWQEFKAERATQALQRMLPATVRVRRDGQESRVGALELVPGDVMLLEEGDLISAGAGQTTLGGRDAGLYQRDLHRQDGNADAERDDRARVVGCWSVVQRDWRWLRARRSASRVWSGCAARQ
jgi:hypothetical protein